MTESIFFVINTLHDKYFNFFFDLDIDNIYMDRALSTDVVGIISEFLLYIDAVKLCYLNKQFYYDFMPIVMCKSIVFVNLRKITHTTITPIGNKSIIPFLDVNNIYIDGIKQIREPIFLYIEKIVLRRCPKIKQPWDNLRFVSFGRSFNLSINNLPINIEEIRFHYKSIFNQKIKKINCPRLRKIYFGKSFNQLIDYLPQSVQIIHFCDISKFNKRIKVFPRALQEISFGQWFNQKIDHLTGTVQKIQFAARSVYSQPMIISAHSKLITLIFGIYYNADLDISTSAIQLLKFYKLSKFNKDIILPQSLKYLYFGKYFNKKIILPDGLIVLKFYAKSKFNNELILPDSCTYAMLGYEFNSSIQYSNSSIVRFYEKKTNIKKLL